MTEERNYWQESIDKMIDGVEHCLDTGEPLRLSLGTDTRNVTIDIYVSKSQMKRFDEMILASAKAQTGIDVVKP